MGFKRQRVPRSSLPRRILEKWSQEVLSEGFVPFPKKLLRCMHRLFEGPDCIKDLAVILAIADFKRPNLTRLPSKDFLAFLAGLNEQEFLDALTRLQQKRFVEVVDQSEGVLVLLNGLLASIEKEVR